MLTVPAWWERSKPTNIFEARQGQLAFLQWHRHAYTLLKHARKSDEDGEEPSARSGNKDIAQERMLANVYSMGEAKCKGARALCKKEKDAVADSRREKHDNNETQRKAKTIYCRRIGCPAPC